MIIINHRINSLTELAVVPKSQGIELDVRYHNDELILHHDPFNHHIKKNLKLKDLLAAWNNRGPIILNLKSEGIEHACIEMMACYKIRNWFFLDMSMPFFVKYSDAAAKAKITNFSQENLAVRFSDKEPLEYTLSFAGKVSWIWLDYFENFPLNKENFLLLKNANFKICLVSPELQQNSILKKDDLRQICSNFDIDAVCTKDPNFWINDTH